LFQSAITWGKKGVLIGIGAGSRSL